MGVARQSHDVIRRRLEIAASLRSSRGKTDKPDSRSKYPEVRPAGNGGRFNAGSGDMDTNRNGCKQGNSFEGKSRV